MRCKIRIRVLLILVLCFLSCSNKDNAVSDDSLVNFRQEMRNLVIEISKSSKQKTPDFIVIPQNGVELVADFGVASENYLKAIDGHGQEELFYGYENNDDMETPKIETEKLMVFLNLSKDYGNVILTTDYCFTTSKVEDAFTKNATVNYTSFAAPDRNLNTIPTYPEIIYGENTSDILKLSDAKNFLYLIDFEKYATKTSLLNAIKATNYDVIIIDAFLESNMMLTQSDVEGLKTKLNGGKRLVIGYMSIGEAESYRYYWDANWLKGSQKPDWLGEKNSDWNGNYVVKYWDKDWHNIIYISKTSYLNRIISAGFDGVYLDVIDAYEYYEE